MFGYSNAPLKKSRPNITPARFPKNVPTIPRWANMRPCSKNIAWKSASRSCSTGQPRLRARTAWRIGCGNSSGTTSRACRPANSKTRCETSSKSCGRHCEMQKAGTPITGGCEFRPSRPDSIRDTSKPAMSRLVVGDRVAPDLDGVAREKILNDLERVLASTQFHSSRKCTRFLRHIVECTLDQQLDRLKERTIGVDVFERDALYDTNQDPIVRGTAGEVRKRLAQYYLASVQPDEVRFSLPAGSYVPEINMLPPPLA